LKLWRGLRQGRASGVEIADWGPSIILGFPGSVKNGWIIRQRSICDAEYDVRIFWCEYLLTDPGVPVVLRSVEFAQWVIANVPWRTWPRPAGKESVVNPARVVSKDARQTRSAELAAKIGMEQPLAAGALRGIAVVECLEPTWAEVRISIDRRAQTCRCIAVGSGR